METVYEHGSPVLASAAKSTTDQKNERMVTRSREVEVPQTHPLLSLDNQSVLNYTNHRAVHCHLALQH
jgi:hypothetical protein